MKETEIAKLAHLICLNMESSILKRDLPININMFITLDDFYESLHRGSTHKLY